MLGRMRSMGWRVGGFRTSLWARTWRDQDEGSQAYPYKARHLPCDPAIPLLGICQREMKAYCHKKIGVSSYIQTWELSKYPSTGCFLRGYVTVEGLPWWLKNLPANAGDMGLFLGPEDPLEKQMATHSSILAWENPTDRGAWQNSVHSVAQRQTERLKQQTLPYRLCSTHMVRYCKGLKKKEVLVHKILWLNLKEHDYFG